LVLPSTLATVGKALQRRELAEGMEGIGLRKSSKIKV
jgi:hypothetical protein